MTWHLDATIAERYSSRDIDGALAGSVEAHVMACERCRQTLNNSVDAPALAWIWQSVEDVLDAPRRSWIDRVLLALGCSDVTTRLVSATTRARWAYLLVVVFNVGVAVASSYSREPDRTFLAFLLFAPLGPLVATAGAFGRWADPTHALIRVLPTSNLRVVLVRTVAGVVPAVVLTAAALPWLADRGWMAVAWLMPALALTLLTLALSTWIDVELAALVVGGLWIVLPLTLTVPTTELIDLIAGPFQVGSIAIAAIAGAATAARRSTFDYREA
jgi:hypothetical protein